jgi:hypothetical protein
MYLEMLTIMLINGDIFGIQINSIRPFSLVYFLEHDIPVKI